MLEPQEQLAAVKGPDKGKVWPLSTEKSYTIGRGRDNVIVLADQTVSGKHALVQFEDGIWFVTDVGSRHGTWVNEARVEARKPLFHKDVIRMGKSYLIYRQGEASEPPDSKLEEEEK